MADTKISELTGANSAAVRKHTITRTDVDSGTSWSVDTLVFPKTANTSGSLYSTMVPWIIETGVAKFAGETRSNAVMAVGYNVDIATGKKDVSDISLGLYFESDYYLSGTRYSEAYISTRGGSSDSNNRPLFFAWNRVTGALTASQVHAAGTNGTTGFKVIRPTGSAGESGSVLHTFSRNTITVECDDTTANTVLSLRGGSTNRSGQITLGYGATANALTVICSSANNAEIQTNGSGAIMICGNPAGGATVGAITLGRQAGDGGGALGNGQLLGVDLSVASNGVHGVRVKGKSAGTGDLLQLIDSSDALQISVTRAGLLTMSTTNMTTGTSTATFTATNKPGASTSVSPTQWVKVALAGGGTYWIPAWAD